MKPCPFAASGCNYPEGECLGLCTPVQMVDEPLDLDSIPPNEIPTPTAPVEGWGWVLGIWNLRVGS